jgi:L-seryl-tRNA(Ser) seleniumtransferase
MKPPVSIPTLTQMSNLRHLPAVDVLLSTTVAADLVVRYGRPLVLEAIRSVLDAARTQAMKGSEIPESDQLMARVSRLLIEWTMPTLIPVINATGVILHTNLGRAPLSLAAQQAVARSSGYCTLEYDLASGKRGSRAVHAEQLLMRLTGAEAALVVNNNAAAVLLTLSALANRKRVIISRTQLVEIGGGFRVPDVMAQSGAKLVEIGTTNRVHLRDYEQALTEPVGLVLRAHSSNFRLIGFTSEPTLAEMVSTAHTAGVSVMDDLGSGALLDTAQFGLAHEPTAQESLAAGADVVCFSGDKLLGGPQAGIILGKAKLLAKIKKHPLARAVRADKLALAALAETLLAYLEDRAVQDIPVWQMIARQPEVLNARAISWADTLGYGDVIEGRCTVGGGSLPEETLPTWLLRLPVPRPNAFLTKLRQAATPVIARIEDDAVVLDPRTVLDDEETPLLNILKVLLTQKS